MNINNNIKIQRAIQIHNAHLIVRIENLFKANIIISWTFIVEHMPPLKAKLKARQCVRCFSDNGKLWRALFQRVLLLYTKNSNTNYCPPCNGLRVSVCASRADYSEFDSWSGHVTVFVHVLVNAAYVSQNHVAITIIFLLQREFSISSHSYIYCVY